jgi:hypothetical protein
MQNKALWDRLAALGGVLFVVLFIVGMLMAGSPPAVDDPSDEVVEFFTDNRGAVLTGTFLLGLGVLAMIWFVASLLEAMRRAGEDRLATAALISFVFGFTAGMIAVLVRAALAFSISGIVDPDETRALYHLSLVVDALSSVVFAGFFAAVGAAAIRTGVLPRGWGWASGVMGLLVLLAATTWSRDGFWSPGGALFLIVNVAFVVWVLVTSVLHYRAVTAASS